MDPTINSTKKTYHDLLLELINLKKQDYDKFMDKLYEALSGEFNEVVHDTTQASEKKRALMTMIQYFQEKEEYEKCADLKRMAESII
jgi:hypothetical protein